MKNLGLLLGAFSCLLVGAADLMVAVKPRPLAPGRHLYSMPVDLASRGENATPAQFLPFRPVGYLNTPTGSVPFEILDLP